jgi:uncharacterized protein YneR
LTFPTIQTSLVSGELSPSLFGRVDKPQYRNGASTMRNCFVRYTGGSSSRPGFSYVGMCKQGAPNSGGTATNNPPRDINFQFNINQGFALEFGDQYMRVKYRGAYVTETDKNISAATNASPLVITSVAHGFLNGDWVYISGMAGMTELNGMTWIVINKTNDTFQLTDLFGTTVNSSAFGVYTSGGTAARIYTVVAPYAAVDLKYLKFTQSANTMTLTCWNQDTNTEYSRYSLVRNSNTSWVFSQISFASVISPPSVVTATATSSTTQNTWYSYIVTSVDAEGNESVASTAVDVFNNNISINAGSNTIQFSHVAGAVNYKIYAATPIFTTTPFANPGFIGVPYGLIGTSFGQQFIDTNIIADFTVTPPLHSDPFARGTIIDVTPTAAGSGLSQATVQYTITTSTGSGFSGVPIVQNGNLVGFDIYDGGKNYANTDTITITTGGAKATGTYTFTGNPTNGQTIILNGVTWTFRTTVTTSLETKIGANLATTLNQLAADLATSSNASITVASYLITTGTVLNITYNQIGTAGNAYTLAAGTYGGSVSGATLSGGGNGASSGATASLTIGAQTGTYPGVVQYYQQRLVYANTINEPDTYFMSRPGLYNNFDSSVPVVNSDAIIGNPWGVQINGIQFLVPTISGLLALTGNGVWLITGGGSNQTAITPSDQNAQAQAQIGCSAIVPPLYVNLHILYVQAKNSIVRDVAYNFINNVFQGTDITVFSNHLFMGYTLTQWAYAEEPFKVIWATRNDGALLSLTYVKEQEIQGWSRHDTNGFFVGVCTVIEPPVDAIYVITKRYISGESEWVYYSERMDNRQWNEIEDCFCVDAGLLLPMTYPNATLTAAAADGTSNITSVNLISGGSGYTSPSAAALDSSGEGTGATFSVSVSGGVITGITPILTGDGYTEGATSIVITDSTGSGAVAHPIITNNVTFTASSSVFTSDMVGDVLRMGGGKATIVSQTGTACVANVTEPITNVVLDNPDFMPVPAESGNWSVATPITEISGLNHLEGMTVTGLADGGVIVPQVVEDGMITLPNEASAIVVGLPFVAQVQTMYLEVNSERTLQGQRKNVQSASVRLEKSRGVQVGTNQPDASVQPNNATVPWTNMKEIKERNALITAGSAIPLFSGDSYILVPGDWDTKGQLACQQIYPMPMNLLAAVVNFTPGDNAG